MVSQEGLPSTSSASSWQEIPVIHSILRAFMIYNFCMQSFPFAFPLYPVRFYDLQFRVQNCPFTFRYNNLTQIRWIGHIICFHQ